MVNYLFDRAFWVAVKALQCDYYGVLSVFQCISIGLLKCCRWLSGCYYVAAKMFRVFSSTRCSKCSQCHVFARAICIRVLL